MAKIDMNKQEEPIDERIIKLLTEIRDSLRV